MMKQGNFHFIYGRNNYHYLQIKKHNLQYLVLKTYAGARYLASTKKTVAKEVTDNLHIPMNDEYDESIENFSINSSK